MLLRSQIDSVVALEFIAPLINTEATCDILKADKVKYNTLYQALNGGESVVPVHTDIELARNIVMNNGFSGLVQTEFLVRQLLPD